MLRLDGKLPEGGFAGYLAWSRQLLSDGEAAALAMASLTPPAEMPKDLPEALNVWYGFETELRNAGIRILASRRRNSSALAWQRETKSRYVWLDKAVDTAINAGSGYNQELALEELRWKFLDEMSTSHQFDLSAAIVYGLRLLILERLNKFDEKKGKEWFDENIQKFADLKLTE